MSEATPTGPRRLVEVVDAPRARVRRPGDLVGLVVTVLGIVVVLLLAVYAHGTTEGVTEDVQSAFARILRGVIQIPVSLLQGLITLSLPWIVVVERVLQRAFRQLLEAFVAGVLGGGLAVAFVWILDTHAPLALTRGLSITTGAETVIAMAPFVAAIAAFLTASGSRDRRRTVAWSWNLFWVGLALAVITNEQTLPGALVTVLLGRAVGLTIRYASGVYNERAYGLSLVEGIRRAGLDPVRIVRVGPLSPGVAPQAVRTASVAPIGYTEHGLGARPNASAPADGEPVPMPVTVAYRADDDGVTPLELWPPPTRGAGQAPDAGEVIAQAGEPATLAHERPGQGRLYVVTDATDRRWDVVALDGDRQVIGTLAAFWSSLRLRGIERRAVVSLRQAAERASLMSYAASAAGVRTPALAGLAEAEDSVILAYEHVSGARRLTDLAGHEVTDAILADAWAQLRRAHAAGLAHRDLTADVVLVRSQQVWIAGWTSGEIASPELARRLDLAQMLALLAVHVGVPRAVASAARVLDHDVLGAIAPLLQPVALPQPTRVLARASKTTLDELRSALIELIPTAAEVEPVQLTRFSVRTAVTATVAVVAVWLLLTTLNLEQISAAVRDANPAWAVVAFGLGMFTYVGAAMSLVAFSPIRIGLWRTTIVQVAASVIALVTPAGVGPAALNLRYLTRRKVDGPLAVASVALMQMSQFVTTVALLLVIAAVTGSSGGALQMPNATTLTVMGAVVLLVGVAFAVPQVRHWTWAKAGPTIRQVWPRVLWVVGQPGRLGMGILGNVIMTGGYIAAFAATLAAFGQHVPLTQLSIIYLGGTALGSAVPTPGGLGTVELALSGGLTAAGIPAAVAASIAVLFRVLTFWGRVPLGWGAMRYLQHKHDI